MSSTNEKLVSVIMPAYNCETFISATIESVLAQSYSNWELIIIDDCSTDGTKVIAQKYANLDKRIKILEKPENSGAAISRNSGVEFATGVYIAFLDSDDIWFEKKLSKQIEFMETNGYLFSCTSYNKIDEQGLDLNRVVECRKTSDYNQILKKNPGNSTVMYNSEVLGKHFIPNIKKRNDYVMWLSVIKEAKTLYGLEEVLSSHRLREGSLSNKKFDLVKYHWIVYRDIEKLSLLKSSYLIFYWILKTVTKF